MYWPIGLPGIYAASSSSKAQPGRVFLSQDDAESRDATEGSFSPIGDLSTISEQEESDFQRPQLTPATPLTHGIKSVDHDHVSPKIYNGDENVFDRSFGQVDREPILALRISRTGHLFATITATTLTIWQTKVCAPFWLWRTALWTDCLTAYRNLSRRCAVAHVLAKVWGQYILTGPSRFCDIRRPNFAGFPRDLFPGLQP